MIELPNTEEIINLLLSFGKHIDKTLIDYHHNVYGRKITATYYVTDGLRETYKTISIYIKDDNILVQIDNNIITYTRFKMRYSK